MATHGIAPPGEIRAADATTEPEPGSSWRMVDFRLYDDGKVPPPTRLPRMDGQCLLYRGKAHSFVGESESLKTWLALAAVRDFLSHGETVVYVDMESDPVTMGARLRSVGVDPLYAEDLSPGAAFGYIRPDEPMLPGSSGERVYLEECEALGGYPDLVIIDGVTEFAAMHGLDLFKADDTAKMHRILTRRRSTMEATTIELDHVAKGSETAYGSQHKRAGITGASYLLVPKTRGGVGGISSAEIRLVKERDGLVGPRCEIRGANRVAGLFEVDSTSGRTELRIVDPASAEAHLEQAKEAGRIVQAAADDEAALAWFRANQPSSTDDLRKAMSWGDTRTRACTSRLEERGVIARDHERKNRPWIAVGAPPA